MARKPTSKSSNSAKSSGQVRIISGKWRSRKLPIHDLAGLRPTTDRVRETLFNWLAMDIKGARVLDCFAGSGALGLEALSRYAEFAQMLELQKSAAKQLQQNLATLQCDNANVANVDSLQYLAQPAAQGFDIIFVDPPFRQSLADKTVNLLVENAWLNQDALIYVETESELSELSVPNNWVQLKQKVAGQVTYRLYQYQA
ncbi:16S rRNA (guanine(966)-N(2))-methyltransferase RsmD [Shewanella maritima]|uniref:16S rRNA (guanine(966)-N(2))-methyltransferase RsmD n=1 Tax=Shewanella maritima TaxID=2520507 RepID=UPI003736EE77